jgi:hypothetical protein
VPRGRPKKSSTTNTRKSKKQKKTVKVDVPQEYNALDYDYTGQAKFNPRNLFEEWGLQDTLKDESVIDKKLYKKDKKPTKRRPPVKKVTVICPICNKNAEIMSNQVNDFAFSIPNDSILPTFKCDKCLGN